MSLKKLRRQIDYTDKEIVRFLNLRASATLKIAEIKRKLGKSIYCPDREREVLRSIAIINSGPLKTDALQAIYREIMSSSLALEKPLRIAYLGPEATFTHQASLKRFGSQVEYVSCDSIPDVFREVEKDNVDYGVVPIENSIEGAVNHTLDMFMDSDLKICAQIILDVSHNLLANPTGIALPTPFNPRGVALPKPIKEGAKEGAKCAKEKIKRIYSNPQVFGQCRIWLQENLPGVEMIEVSSTTRAAQISAKEKYSASIASLLAAKIYKLEVIARSIEDSPHNITRFLVIGKTDVPYTGHDRTSLMFSIKDRVGALHDMLLPFKKYRVNLDKIESRPSKKKAWDYYFYVDLEGHQDEPRVKKALLELENKCKFLKLLGSYPIGE